MVERTGQVQTVNGLISPDQLGLTLMHEHLLCDLRVRFAEPEEVARRAFAQQPLQVRDRWRVCADLTCNRDNLVLDNIDDAVQEVLDFKKAGGRTIVDQTTRGLGRDPQAIRAIASLTDVNVIMGTGYYVHLTHPPDMTDRSQEALAEEMSREIVEGIDATGVRCGIIGEIGCEMLTDNELKVVRAAARAQRMTGAMISIHTMFVYSGREAGLRIAQELETAGADLSRVILCHQDGSGIDFAYQQDLLRRGVNLEYDLFGFELAFAASGVVAQWPTDTQRIQELKRLIDAGWIRQLFVSQDVCVKLMTRQYGGWGYAHIVDVLLPRFVAAGVSAEDIQTLMVENPQRLLVLQ